MDSNHPNYEKIPKQKRSRKNVSSQAQAKHPDYVPQNFQSQSQQAENLSYSQFSEEPSDQHTSYGCDAGFDQYAVNNNETDVDDEGFIQPSPQYFTQLLSESTSQQASLQSTRLSNPDLTSSNKKIWSTVEDEALISSYMNTSSNQLVGTDQRKGVFWQKVWTAFEAARSANPNEISFRNAHMVKGRWSRIATMVLRWAAFYDEALARKRSGQNDDDVLREAHILHERKNGRFILIHCWELLCKFPKWRSLVEKSLITPRGRPKREVENVSSPGSGSSGKRQRDDNSDSLPNTPTSGEGGEGIFSRPEGVKKAKSRLKGVAGETIECFNSFNERLRLHSESRIGDIERERERLEVQKEKVALKKQQMDLQTRSLNLQEYRNNWDMLQTLSLKENRLPFEEEMFQQLTAWFQNYKMM